MPRSLSPVSAMLHANNFPALPDNTVTCIGVCLDDDIEACSQAARPYVHAAEYLRAQKYIHSIDAARHLVGRALVRRMLELRVGCDASAAEFVLNAWGKPALPGSEIEFSITHSGEWVWVAFSRAAAVGIDIEEVQPLLDLNDLVGVLHPEESKVIRQLPEHQASAAFYRCWARKEAVLKALGEGLSRPLDSFLVKTEVMPGGWLTEIAGDQVDQWSCTDVAIPGPVRRTVAVAVRAPDVSVQVQVWMKLNNTAPRTAIAEFQDA